MKILVTGGMGFIGSALVLHLVEDGGHEVVTLDALTHAANPASLKALAGDARHVLVEADICDASRVRGALAAHRPDAVIHLAAEGDTGESRSGPGACVRTNVVGTQSLLDAVRAELDRRTPQERERFRFVHVSTGEVFGAPREDGTFTEASPYDPLSPHAASKAAANHIVRAYGHAYGLPVLVAICSNTFGPRQSPGQPLPRAIIGALEGRPVSVEADDLDIRDWLHVDDQARALSLVLAKGLPGESYCIAGRTRSSALDLMRMVCGVLDETRPGGAPHARLLGMAGDGPEPPVRRVIVPDRIERQLGFAPALALDEALRRTVAWYLANGDWWNPPAGSTHGGERSGLFRRG